MNWCKNKNKKIHVLHMFEEKCQRATKTTKSNLKEKCEIKTRSFFSYTNSRRPRSNEHGETTSYNLRVAHQYLVWALQLGVILPCSFG